MSESPDRSMETIRKLAIAMLVIGLVLLLWGYARYMASHQSVEWRMVHLIALAIPGWTLVIMGWVGLVAHRLRQSVHGSKAESQG
jgi:uncharacterized membrane protein